MSRRGRFVASSRYLYLFERLPWPSVIVAFGLFSCLATIVVFSPGYMSTDTFAQLRQALGREPLSDWHPPIMSLVWSALIHITGTVSTMAVLQSIVFWLSLATIAWALWRATDSRPLSLSVLAVGFTPHVLTFVGVVWKDVHMALALLASLAVALTLRELRSPGDRRARLGLLAVGLLLLCYAALVRKNAVFSLPPMFVLMVWAYGAHRSWRTWAASAVVVLVGTVGGSLAITAFAKPVQTHQFSQIQLDDLIHVVGINELRKADVPPDLRTKLVSASQKCTKDKVLYDAYWKCYGRGERGAFTAVAHTGEISDLWFKKMASHPGGYLQYRAQVFGALLFDNDYYYRAGVGGNDLGIDTSHPRMEGALRLYVEGMQKDLPWLFTGWFWLCVGALLSASAGVSRLSVPIRLIGLSSVFYIIGYFPVAAANDYRYVYWPAIAGSLGLLMRWLSRRATEQTSEPTMVGSPR